MAQARRPLRRCDGTGWVGAGVTRAHQQAAPAAGVHAEEGKRNEGRLRVQSHCILVRLALEGGVRLGLHLLHVCDAALQLHSTEPLDELSSLETVGEVDRGRAEVGLNADVAGASRAIGSGTHAAADVAGATQGNRAPAGLAGRPEPALTCA